MEYVEPSNATAFYLKHVEAMKATEEQPEGRSFALPKEGYSLALLRDLAELANVGKRAYVVIEWPQAFEVQRLPDGSNTKLFYRYLAGSEKPSFTNNSPSDKLRDFLRKYNELPLESCSQYDKNITEEMKSQNYVTYTLLQRRLAGVAAFRNSAKGSTETLKDCIAELAESGELVELPEELVKSSFELSGKVFKIALKSIYEASQLS